MTKKVIRYIISILLSISIIALILVLLTSLTILDRNYVFSKFEENGYYTKMYEAVKSNFENYMYQSGLEPTVFEDIISLDKVKEDTQIIINNIYAGLNEKIDAQPIKDKINANIDKELGSDKLNITQRKAIDTLIDKIADEYTNTILHFDFENQINSIFKTATKYLDLAKKALIVLIAVCIIALIAITTRRIYRIFNFLGISFISSGAFLAIIHLYINLKLNVQTIVIFNDAMSEVLRTIFGEILTYMMICGYTLILLGVIGMLLANFIHNKNKYSEKY